MIQHSLLFAALFASSAAFAQSETDLDDFDDLTAAPEATIADEKAALLEEPEEAAAGPEERTKLRKRVIKTLQRKTFMKIGRTEIGLGGGLVTNDPFINRYIVRLDATYHFTEIASFQIEGGFSPNLGEADWKPITQQIIRNNKVTPDISKIQFYGDFTLQFAPIYGKVAAPGNKIINFDIYGLFGTGIVQTADDLVALGKEQDPVAQRTEAQIHPSLNFGGGARVIFGKNLALRVEGRGISFIEILDGTSLEMKNNVILQASVAYFLGKAN